MTVDNTNALGADELGVYVSLTANDDYNTYALTVSSERDRGERSLVMADYELYVVAKTLASVWDSICKQEQMEEANP